MVMGGLWNINACWLVSGLSSFIVAAKEPEATRAVPSQVPQLAATKSRGWWATRRCPKGSLSNFALLVSLLWDGSEDLAGLFKLLHHVHISTTSWSMMVFTTMIMVTVLDCSRLPMGPGAGAPPFNELIEPKLEEAWRKDFVKSWRQASQLQVSSSPLCTAPSRAKLDGCNIKTQNQCMIFQTVTSTVFYIYCCREKSQILSHSNFGFHHTQILK